MADPRLERLADVLVGYSAQVRPGDLVLISSTTLAGDLVREVYSRVLAAGGNPVTRIAVEGVAESQLELASDEQLAWQSPVRRAEMEAIDVYIAILAEWNTRSLTQARSVASGVLKRSSEELRRRYLERAAAGDLRWVLTAYPTNAAAQDAGMSLPEYEDFVYRAAFLDDGDPIARWEAFAARLTSIAEFLAGRQELRIVADGTDLRLGVGGRSWESPGPRELPRRRGLYRPRRDECRGDDPLHVPGRLPAARGARRPLRFEGGEVVEATAARGEDFLRADDRVDDGARRVGEFAFGLNDGVDVLHQEHPVRREDRRHDPPRARQAYPETGGRTAPACTGT